MITRTDTEKIASLARLEFSENEIQQLTGELNNIIGYVDQLNELDVSSVEPLENINEAITTNTFRADESNASLPTAEALKNAPKSGDGFFLVPKVLDQTKKVDTPVFNDEEEPYE
ncbi:MAG TPA: Asp-tRNA(Asn)/Glu-tRNA(Gln) amidotransferase subunit GatC [Candidatus Kapabacteria bacterium]|nr:Asp-tRNA(Asn)/Glu-tRNA(Gln) amidotransferase subunit GatC [Candidatus Kapabacteria bacterium]